MKFPSPVSIEWIATLIDASIEGNTTGFATGINEIHKVEKGDLVFVDHPKYYDKALQSAATIVLINKNVDCPNGKALLISDDPFKDFNKLTNYFKPFQSSICNLQFSIYENL